MRTREICLFFRSCSLITVCDAIRSSSCLLATVNHFQNLQCLHPLKNAAKSFLSNILPVSLTRSRFCRVSFKTSQWFQDFSDRVGGGGVAVVGCQRAVASTEVGRCIVVMRVEAENCCADGGCPRIYPREPQRSINTRALAPADFAHDFPFGASDAEGTLQSLILIPAEALEFQPAWRRLTTTPTLVTHIGHPGHRPQGCASIQCLRAYSARSTA